MKRYHLFVLGWLLILLCSCRLGGSANITPTVNALPAVATPTAPAITRIPSPTVTVTFTTTPSPSAKPTHTPTASFTPTSSEVLPVITSDWYRDFASPTPLATPEFNANTYPLKHWEEADALALIRTLELYAHENDLMGAAHARINFGNDYNLVELAIRETLFRFPDSSYQELLNWRLAMAVSLQGEPEMDGWVLDAIAGYLNQTAGADLDAWLAPLGFIVAQEMTASNLFGDGTQALVYRIQPPDSYGERGLVFAVRKQSQESDYQIFRIYGDDSYWGLYIDYPIVGVEDHNQNGLPEVVLEDYASSGSMCSSHILIYEWRDEQFVDLTKGEIGSGDCLPWSFGEPDAQGADTITTSELMYPIDDTYAWNGSYYELIERRFRLKKYSVPVVCADYDLVLSGWEDYKKGISALQAVLQDWTAQQTETFGASCQDILRIRIGLAYAEHGEIAKAREVFRAVAASPLNPDDPITAEVVNIFLENYTGQGSLYHTCNTAREAISARYKDGEIISPEDSWRGFICEEEAVFRLLVESLDRSHLDDPIPVLKEAGVPLRASVPLDADQDGDLDWLVVTIGTYDDYIYAMLNTGSGFQLVYLDYIYDFSYDSEQKDIEVDTYTDARTGEHFVILVAGSQFFAYQFGGTQAESIAVDVIDDYNVMSYEFVPTDRGLELEVSYGPSDYQSRILDIYRWDGQGKQFRILPFYEDDLFSEDALADSLPYLERLVPILKSTRFLYLLGLAYELTGESSKAAEIYWQIWHDYPETGYARMACSKLENCSP